MLLAVDIGNTSISLGIFSNGALISDFSLARRPIRIVEAYRVLLSEMFSSSLQVVDISFSGGIISSVVPILTPIFSDVICSFTGTPPLIIDGSVTSPVSEFIPDAAGIGPDRIANTAAGIEFYGTPLVVVDFGTATTFSVVDKNARFLGGAISPGIRTGADALFEKASRLLPVELAAPDRAIGSNTSEDMRSGIIFGHASMVDGMLKKIDRELGEQTAKVATGGYAEIVVPFCENLKTVRQRLTLEGLNIIYGLL